MGRQVMYTIDLIALVVASALSLHESAAIGPKLAADDAGFKIS